ncbi:MAG: tetratricopeptide repeat protein [Chloroflexota bacterium]
MLSDPRRADSLPSPPSFSLPGAYGETITLAALRATAPTAILLFVDLHDESQVPVLDLAGRWQREQRGRATIAVLADAPEGRARELATRARPARFLLAPGGVTFAAFGVNSTPAAVAVRADGRVSTSVAAGLPAIRAMVPDALGVGAEIRRLTDEAERALGRGQVAAAIAGYRQALALWSDRAEVLNWLGAALAQAGQLPEAVDAFQRAIAADPGLATAHYNLGIGQLQLGQPAAAASALEQALVVDPGYAEAAYNLGIARQRDGRLTDAVAAYRRAVELRPSHVESHNNLGTALVVMGEIDAAVAAYRASIQVRPDFQIGHANLVMTRHYQADCSRVELAEEARTWADRHAPPAFRRSPEFRNDRSPTRRLQVGYVSADFWRHPIGYIMDAVIPAHDREQIVVTCYANGGQSDDVNARLRQSADRWRDVQYLDDVALAQQVRDDGIDILVDLAGHTSGHRLAAFARRPAPVQLTWLGNADTTGMTTIDYIVADPYVVPPDDEFLYAEQTLRLPESYLCYAPHPFAPEVGPLPARTRGHVTFGCFNNLAKVTSEVMALWAEILKRVPESQLLMKTPALDDSGVRARYQQLFAESGVSPERLRLVGRTSQADVLGMYNEVDVALDPFPYNGCMTTLEALWMGVPVVALEGDRYVSRVGLSLLSTLGLADLCASSTDGYVTTACALAGDVTRMASLRAELRLRMRRSSLIDAGRFTSGLDAAYRSIWQSWCAAGQPATPRQTPKAKRRRR